MSERLTAGDLVAIVRRVFTPGPADRAMAILVDLPDAKVPDNPDWHLRRAMAREWAMALQGSRSELGMEVRLVAYPNVHTNNGDLPERVWIHEEGPLPEDASGLDSAASVPLEQVFAECSILIAPTEFSATAPLKMASRTRAMRAATMPGFSADMIPALRLDYQEVNRRVGILKDLLDRATGADLRFRDASGECSLHLDLRHRTAHASGGLLPANGVAGNLPSGEAYIVPYEGEVMGDMSLSQGVLPVQFGSEVVKYRIAANRAVEVLTRGPESEREAALLEKEPAYANLAELGMGVLGAFGVKPCGEVLLDEKLGLHIAFGRSEHFGGQVGPKDFSSPEAVIHIDRVYVPETQPEVQVLVLDLSLEDGSTLPVLRDGDYVLPFTPPAPGI